MTPPHILLRPSRSVVPGTTPQHRILAFRLSTRHPSSPPGALDHILQTAHGAPCLRAKGAGPQGPHCGPHPVPCPLPGRPQLRVCPPCLGRPARCPACAVPGLRGARPPPAAGPEPSSQPFAPGTGTRPGCIFCTVTLPSSLWGAFPRRRGLHAGLAGLAGAGCGRGLVEPTVKSTPTFV